MHSDAGCTRRDADAELDQALLRGLHGREKIFVSKAFFPGQMEYVLSHPGDSSVGSLPSDDFVFIRDPGEEWQQVGVEGLHE